VKRLARGLDGAAVVLAALAVGVLALGRLRLGRLTLQRPEDLLVALAVIVALRLVLAPVTLPKLSPRLVVTLAAALYVALMGFIVVSRHVALRTHALDLGYYVQLVWSLAHGDGARVTLPPMHAWGDHFSPVLYLFTPLGWLAPGATALLLAQTVIFAAGAFAIAAYARSRLADAALAAGVAVVYLLNPTLHGINIRDVHPTAFAIPLLVAAAWAVDARRFGWAAAFVVLALGGREDAAIAGVGFGVWLALARRRWVAGGAVAAACVALLWLDMNVVMPHFRGEPYPHLVKRWAYLGDSLSQVVLNFFVEPWRWLRVVLTVDKLIYLLALLAPLGFLPLLAPRAAAAALPGLAVNLLSTDPVLFHHRTPYQAFVLPFLLLAAVDGVAVLKHATWRPRRLSPSAALVAAGVLAVVLTARTVNDLGVGKWRLGEQQRAVHRLLERVPAAAAVAVNERLVPHLATRREVYIFPDFLARSEWILDQESAVSQARVEGFETVARERGFILLRRTAPLSGGR
jgi:uncharacterized membrane protein